ARGPDAREPGRVGTLALVLVVGLAACLVNPFFYHAFTLPTDLSYLLASASDWFAVRLADQLTGAGRALKELTEEDPGAYASFFQSPLSSAYFQPENGLNVAGMAYYVLLLAGLASFALNPGVWPWARFLVWLGFALLSFAQSRLIGFFAVVAGPITALN